MPNQFTYRLPTWLTSDRTLANALYVQDHWTARRLTLGRVALRHGIELEPGRAQRHDGDLAVQCRAHQLYAEDRLTQVDMRFAKVIRFGGRRADIGVDLYNLFNTNTAAAYDGTYDYGSTDGGTWLQPTSIVQPRFVRFNLTLSF